MPSRLAGLLAALVALTLLQPSRAGDWPTWRHDAQRSATAADDLPDDLRLHWALNLPALDPAWPDQPMMPFDAVYEPIVVGQTMFVGSSRTDSVTAYDTRTGEQRWRFLADGPIRFAPLWHAGSLYVVSDDGHLYCLAAATGEVRWKFRGGPSDRRILGNSRLISMWPARGAPVIADGTVYFAASIWPFMGTFIHALDAATGEVIWTNDGDGSLYIKQPHSADSFAGVAPQGPMAIAGDLLLIPGGRSVPAAYDRKTGKLVHFLLNANSKKGGGHTATVAGDVFFNGPGAFLSSTGVYLGTGANIVTATEDVAHAYQGSEVRTLDLKGADLKPPKWKVEATGAVKVPGVTTMIRAGDRLYLGTKGKVVALDLPLPEEAPDDMAFAWKALVDGSPGSLVAADDRLFVSTKEGAIYCFGPGDPPAVPTTPAPEAKPTPKPAAGRAILKATGVTEGYAVVWSAEPGLLIDLARASKLHLIAIDPDAAKVRTAREALIAADLYGHRVAVHQGEPGSFALPPYLASLMVAPGLSADLLPRVYESVRPYGGTLLIPGPVEDAEAYRKAAEGLVRAVVKEAEGGGLRVTREGALPGAGSWTHEHADAANTRVSQDSIVKAPLGVLWFGGTSNESILPRHGHGPQPQVVGGRVIVEGMDLLRAVDVYTGRLLWEAKLPGVGDFYNNTAHQPGANARGTNYISMPDGIYVAYKNGCVRLDPATGKRVAEFQFPPVPDHPTPLMWGHLNVVGDYLIAAADPHFTAEAEKQAKSVSKLLKLSGNDLYSSSRYLAVLDRHTGKPLWTKEARTSFRHNTLCAGNGKLFAIDRISRTLLSKRDEDAADPDPPCVVAWDLATGRELWRTEADVFGTWLSYSEKHDVLVEAGRVARDTLTDEPVGMRAYRGTDGQELWYQKKYTGPAMLHGDMILRGQGACDLLTGKPRLRTDPITGAVEEWAWSRNYGCNTPAASQHLLTFRSGAAGFYDLCNDGGTGNWGGFRSSCTNNLIVADGVLTAPDYTRTCTCSYQNQCSIALVPMADVEQWRFLGKSGARGTVRRVGINLGAPGDRRSPEGTLWIEYPGVGGPSPTVSVHVAGKHLEYFRRHESNLTGDLPWIGASGVVGVESLVVGVQPERGKVTRPYTVRLYFAEPEELKAGERVFAVTLQGRRVLTGFDVVKAAGQPRRVVTREFRGIHTDNELRLSFRPAGPLGAVLCGLEVVEE